MKKKKKMTIDYFKDSTIEFIKLWFRMEKVLGRILSFEEIDKIREEMEKVENENKTSKL